MCSADKYWCYELKPSPQYEQKRHDDFLPMSSTKQIIHINRAEFTVGNTFRGMVVKHSKEYALLMTNATAGLEGVQHAPNASTGQRVNVLQITAVLTTCSHDHSKSHQYIMNMLNK
jgi:hypothetical protein